MIDIFFSESLKGKTSMDLKVRVWFLEHHWTAVLQIALNFFPWKKYLKISWGTYSYAVLCLGLSLFRTTFPEISSAENHKHWLLVLPFRERKANYHSSFYRSLIRIAKLLQILLPSPLFQTKLGQICPFFISKAWFLKALLYSCFSMCLSCPVLEEFSSQGSL